MKRNTSETDTFCRLLNGWKITQLHRCF